MPILSGQKKPVQWTIVGAVAFAILSFAIFVADKVFNFNVISFNLFFFIVLMAMGLFAVMSVAKVMKGGPFSIDSLLPSAIIIAGIILVYHYFPGIMPRFSSAVEPIFSALGLP